MVKKTFAAAPKPRQLTVEEIEAYERGGAGQDNSSDAQSRTGQARQPSEPTKRLSLDLPASVHTRFKTACSATGLKMVSELLDLIETRTVELEAEAGLSRK